MDRKPFETLARFVQTLAAGREVVTPFAMGQRGNEWKEHFLVGRDRVASGEAVLHGMTRRKDGDVTRQRDEPCEWSLDDILKWFAEMDDADFAAVELQLLDIEDCGPTVQAIADFADGPGTVAMLGGTLWGRPTTDERLESKGDGKWSLDETVAAVRKGR